MYDALHRLEHTSDPKELCFILGHSSNKLHMIMSYDMILYSVIEKDFFKNNKEKKFLQFLIFF